MTENLPLAASIAIRCMAFVGTRQTAEEWARLARHEGAPDAVVDAALAEWDELNAASVQIIRSSAVTE